MAFEHGHHQSQRLVLGEDDRRQPHSPAEPVAAVAAACGLDRYPGLAQDCDVPACRAVRDPEVLSDLVGGRAGLHLQDLQRRQGASRGADGSCHICERRRLLALTGSQSSGNAPTVEAGRGFAGPSVVMITAGRRPGR
jgi:hypothetical protein